MPVLIICFVSRRGPEGKGGKGGPPSWNQAGCAGFIAGFSCRFVVVVVVVVVLVVVAAVVAVVC